MSELPTELDLKFLPDWLKESPVGNRYADFEGERPERPRREGGGHGDRRGGGGGPRNDRGPRRDGPPGARRDGPPRGGGGKRPFDKNRGGGDRDQRGPRPPREAPRPLTPVQVEFLPEPNGLAGITRQIKAGSRAYPLFGTARLFLERPERHRVRITSLEAGTAMFQIGDGPVSFDQAAVERSAFHTLRDEYYKEETVQGEPLKGNFRNVARCRSTGTLLGPTNYHAYQPGLRKLYEERFSRRMSFPQFQHEEIEIVSDEQAVADWKEQARSTTTYTTLKEAEPVVFKSAFDVEQHFRKHYLAEAVKTGQTLETSGPASRATSDRSIGTALRTAWEAEKQFPQNIVNLLRPAFHDAGLHYFKHRKRMIFVSPIRPQPAPRGQTFSDGIASILTVVREHPRATRHDLAVRILGEGHDSPDAAPRKAALAGDLHYLVHQGHVIEFHDGTLDLPLTGAEKPEGAGKKKAADDAGEPIEVTADREAEAEPISASQEAAPLAEAVTEEVSPAAETVSEETSPVAETTPEAVSSEAPLADEVALEVAPPAPESAPEPTAEEVPPAATAAPELAAATPEHAAAVPPRADVVAE